jgi:hypothetical protein
MISFTMKADTDRLQRKLNNLVNAQMPYATSLAINETLKTLEKYNKALMTKAFRDPVPFTMNAFYVQYSNKRNLQGFLRRKEKAVGRHYLEVQDKGGKRPLKGFEKKFVLRQRNSAGIKAILPTDTTPVDGRGNMTMAFVNKVSSQLSLNIDAATNKPYQLRVGKRQRRSTATRYFVPDPSHPLAKRGGMGVYATKADPLGQERVGSRVNKVMNFLYAAPTYKKRTDFDNNMRRAAANLMPKKMSQGIRRALATARLR